MTDRIRARDVDSKRQTETTGSTADAEASSTDGDQTDGGGTAAETASREMRNEWLLIVAGIISILAGIALAVFPGAGALSLVWLIGTLAIVAGVMLIVIAFRLRELRHRFAAP